MKKQISDPIYQGNTMMSVCVQSEIENQAHVMEVPLTITDSLISLYTAMCCHNETMIITKQEVV